MEQDKTSKLVKDMEHLGFAPLVREMRRKIQDQEQLFLAYRDPGNVQLKMPMLCIVDIRRHGINDEYYIHNYAATITKENIDRNAEKYITRSKTFYARQGKLPTIQRARHFLQQDIHQKQLKKEVKRKQRQKRKGIR